MENTCDVKHYDKVFGNCEVHWHIEDFCLATCDENCRIQSSEFCITGPELTTWKLVFIPKLPTTSSVRLYLERLSDPGPLIVCVNWSLSIGSVHKNYYYSEYKHYFEKLSKKRTDVHDLSGVLSLFQPFECDTLVIRLHLIVQYVDRTVKLDKPKTLGLRCLSEDLRRLLRSDEDKNFILPVGKSDISVHRAVLSRNAVLQKLIHNADANTEMFSNLNSSTVTKYVDYLYTGDLDKILQNPSISMYRCLEVMDMDLLKCYFALEEVRLHTKIKVEEFEHLWIIQNFSDRKEESLRSPLFKQTNLDTTWQLRVNLHGVDNIHYLSIYADIVEGTKPSNMCLEFAVEDSEGDTYYSRKILSFKGKCDLGIKEFVNKVYLTKSNLVADGTLNLTFKVRTWNGEYCSKTGSRMISFTTETEDSSYIRLSKSLLYVYRLSINTDILLQADNAFFEAHKCILSIRSPILSSMIKAMKYNTFITLRDITSSVLKLLLEYIYCGVLLKFDHQTLVMLHKAAQTYRISSLEEECQHELLNSVGRKPLGLQ